MSAMEDEPDVGFPYHRQVHLVQPDGQEVEVDEGIADFLRECWRLGLDTGYSCQGGMPYDGFDLSSTAYVAFLGAGDADRVADALGLACCVHSQDGFAGEIVPPLHFGLPHDAEVERVLNLDQSLADLCYPLVASVLRVEPGRLPEYADRLRDMTELGSG